MPALPTSLDPLVATLRGDGYRVVGPTVRDGAIVLAELDGADRQAGNLARPVRESGCVGCGRYIVWCPVGIDITEETNALAAEREATE